MELLDPGLKIEILSALVILFAAVAAYFQNRDKKKK